MVRVLVVMIMIMVMMIMAMLVFLFMIVLVIMMMFVIMRVFMFMHMLMLVIVHLFGFRFAVYRNVKMRSADPAFFGGFFQKTNAGDRQRVELLKERVAVGEQLVKRGGEHIAGGAHRAVKIQ